MSVQRDTFRTSRDVRLKSGIILLECDCEKLLAEIAMTSKDGR
jgi:hypothetical protein